MKEFELSTHIGRFAMKILIYMMVLTNIIERNGERERERERERAL